MMGQVARMVQNRNAYKVFFSENLKERKHLEGEAHAYSICSLWVTCCLAKSCYVACRHILDEKTSFNTPPGKAKEDCSSNFENL